MTDKNMTTLDAAASADLNSNFLVRLDGETEDKSLTGTRLMTMIRTLVYSIAGQGISIKEGANAKAGVATLVAGTVTVSNTSVTATSRIKLSIQSLGTVTSPMAIGVTARVAGTSFTITSSDNTDTSVIYWEINENT